MIAKTLVHTTPNNKNKIVKQKQKIRFQLFQLSFPFRMFQNKKSQNKTILIEIEIKKKGRIQNQQKTKKESNFREKNKN